MSMHINANMSVQFGYWVEPSTYAFVVYMLHLRVSAHTHTHIYELWHIMYFEDPVYFFSNLTLRAFRFEWVQHTSRMSEYYNWNDTSTFDKIQQRIDFIDQEWVQYKMTDCNRNYCFLFLSIPFHLVLWAGVSHNCKISNLSSTYDCSAR